MMWDANDRMTRTNKIFDDQFLDTLFSIPAGQGHLPPDTNFEVGILSYIFVASIFI